MSAAGTWCGQFGHREAPAQIKFMDSWDEAISSARMNGKLIFLNAYTEWCEPCDEMEEYTFTDLEVANFFNSTFVNVQLDMEDYPGVELAEAYTIGVFPSSFTLSHSPTLELWLADTAMDLRNCGAYQQVCSHF